MALRFWVGRRAAIAGNSHGAACVNRESQRFRQALKNRIPLKLVKTKTFFLTRKPQRRATTHMGKAVLDVSMSLDGYITGPDNSREQPLGEGGTRLHEWVSTTTQELMQGGTSATTGAIVTGRRTYDLVDGFGGSHRIAGAPVFVLTHDAPATVPQGATPFTFVTDGIESALTQAVEFRAPIRTNRVVARDASTASLGSSYQLFTPRK